MEQVRALLETPQRRVRKGAHVFWVYPELGLDVEFAGQKVSGLFFFRQDEEGHTVTAAVRLHSARFNRESREILKTSR